MLFGSHIEIVVIVHVPVLVPCEVGRKIYIDLTFLFSILGCDHYNAVGSTRTIYSGCGCVLEHIDTLDVIRIDIIEATLDRQTVNHKQRSSRAAEGADATDDGLAPIGG